MRIIRNMYVESKGTVCTNGAGASDYACAGAGASAGTGASASQGAGASSGASRSAYVGACAGAGASANVNMCDFDANVGVKQGDGASPELFALYFDRVYKFLLQYMDECNVPPDQRHLLELYTL